MVSDEILSRETSLIYQYAFGFEPVEGNLRNWHGLINDKNGNTVSVTLTLPNNYPNAPPDVFLQEGIVHPNITNGKFLTRSVARWKSNYHVHQIIREVRQVISSSVIRSTAEVPLQSQQSAVDSTLNNQLTMLRQQLEAKKQEHQQAQSQGFSSSQMDNTLTELTDDTLVDIQNELFALEDAYDRADMNGVEFSKQFLTLQKRYYMIHHTR
ncbi:MAG: ubiquitin-conjugating enzyme E2 [Candidatus Kariarchaeaceae archaeon]|jgi:ubiquitin-protein ligase